MNKHLNTYGKLDPSEGFIVFGVQTKLEGISYEGIWCIINCQKWIRIKKVMAPQNRRGQELEKNKSRLNVTMSIFEHAENSLYVVLLLLEFKDDL